MIHSHATATGYHMRNARREPKLRATHGRELPSWGLRPLHGLAGRHGLAKVGVARGERDRWVRAAHEIRGRPRWDGGGGGGRDGGVCALSRSAAANRHRHCVREQAISCAGLVENAGALRRELIERIRAVVPSF